MKKRILALSLAAAMLVGAMASCNAKEEVVSSAVEARDISLVLWGSENDQDFLKSTSAEWATKYAEANADVKSVTVDVQIVGEGDSKGTALNDLDAAADVFGVASDAVGDLVNATAIYKMPDSIANEIKNVATDATYSASLFDGSCYGFPYTTNTAEIMFYNKSMFNEDEVKSLNTILDKDLGEGVTNLVVDFNSGWNGMTWFATGGAELYTGGDTKVNTLNKPEAAEVLKYMQAKFAEKKVIDTDSNDSAAGLLKDGAAAALFYGSWSKGSFSDALGDNYGVAELPSLTIEGTSVTNAHLKCFGGNKMLVIKATTKEPEAALDLAQYITSEENQLKRFEAVGMLPAAKSAASNSAVTADPSIAAEVAQSAYVLNSTSAVGASGWWAESGGLLGDIMTGTIAADDIQGKLDTLVETMQANFA